MTNASDAASNQPSRTDILLDAGTNELEVLVFGIDGCTCGVNVAKVREVIRPVEATQSPHQHKSVIGMFNMRGTVMPLVDLKFHLNLSDVRVDDPTSHADSRIIITDFNGMHTAFLVDDVEQIYRMNWQSAQPAPDLHAISGNANKNIVGVCTGVVQMDERLILMLDFESIADAILMEERLHIESVPNTLGIDRASKRIVLAEDSPFMRNLMERVFKKSGYTNIEIYPDGQSAYDCITAPLAEGQQPIDGIISDIEMPRMDGLHLTKRVKENDQLKHIPILLFSSLISDDNRKKGKQVGANIQIAKPELTELVHLVDQLVTGQYCDNETRAA
jgi:two-component system, chemotaxis family, chemotaxis protein CheV